MWPPCRIRSASAPDSATLKQPQTTEPPNSQLQTRVAHGLGFRVGGKENPAGVRELGRGFRTWASGSQPLRVGRVY